MSFTAFPIPSVELSTIALDARNAINALENTNAAVNAAIALDTAATYVALDASAGGGGALDADKLAKFQDLQVEDQILLHWKYKFRNLNSMSHLRLLLVKLARGREP